MTLDNNHNLLLYSGISNWLASRIGWPRHTNYIDARMAAAAAYDTDILTGTTGTVCIRYLHYSTII